MIIRKDLYDHPHEYDLALCSFRDVKAEGDVTEDCIRRCSCIPVTDILENACGPAPNAIDLVSRGYRYTGLDLNPAMVSYRQEKHCDFSARMQFGEADVLAIPTRYRADLTLTLAGSFFPLNNQEIQSHFKSMAQVLRKGWLYLLDSCIYCIGAEEDNPRGFQHVVVQ